MSKQYVHTRAGGFKRWVCVAMADTQTKAREEIDRLKQQDDPMWATAEYLISDSLHPREDEQATVRGQQ